MAKDSNLQNDTYSAIRWSAASKYISQAVQFSVSIFLARLLAPEFFGLLGMAMVVTGFAKTLTKLGFRPIIIQRKDLDHVLTSTLFWINLAFCAFITLLLVGVAPLAAWIYSDERITPIVAVLAMNVLFNSFCTVPAALLERRLEFNKLAIREIGSAFITGAVGISCALLGWEVWALVAATLATSISNMILLNIVEPFWPSFTLDWRRLKECLNFGLNITGFSIFNHMGRSADKFIIGAFLGPIALGYFSLANRLLRLPTESLASVVSRVLLPKMSKLQTNDKRLGELYLQATGAIAMAAFPMMIGIATISDCFVPTILGTKWVPAILVLQILAPVGALRAVGIIFRQVLLAKGNPALMFRIGVIEGTATAVCVFAGSYWGIYGVSISLLALSVPLFLIKIWAVTRVVPTVNFRSVFAGLLHPAIGSIICAAASCFSQYLFSDHSIIALIVASFFGAASYLAYLQLADPASLSILWRLTLNRQNKNAYVNS